MNTMLLQKYISGHASEVEKQFITAWIQENPENQREYMAQRKLYDFALWRADSMMQSQINTKRRFLFGHTAWMKRAKIAAMITLIMVGSYYWLGEGKKVKSPSLQSIYVPAGQRAELLLADGTKVWLNSRSTLSFPEEFTDNKRSVKLDGEGYFAVTKNSEQPFIVETNRYLVKVLGTEFNVSAYTTDSIWETSLLKGSVEILKKEQTTGIRLEPNTMVSLKENKLLKRAIKEADYFRWREGIMCFDNISVEAMMEKLQLYYGISIVVNNNKILKNRYTGKFRTSDGIEHMLKVLKLNNQFTYIKNDETNVITIN